jgi:D-alanine--poly(phosphoribitol) ligase subunit 1
MDVFQQIYQNAKDYPKAAAHRYADKSLAYGDLLEQALRFASYLAERYSTDKKPCVILGHKESELLIGFLGCAFSGTAYVPLDTTLPKERIDHIVSVVESPEIFTVERIKQILLEHKKTLSDPLKAAAADPAYIMFTSGSTGQPKGVEISRGNLNDFVQWMSDEQKFAFGGEVFLNQAPFSFDLSIMDLYLSLSSAGTLFSIIRDEIINPAELFKTLERSEVSVWVSTPSFAQLCASDALFSEKLLPNIKKFLFCGETLPASLARELLTRFPKAQVWNTYGPTEATVATSSILVSREIAERFDPLPIGYCKARAKLFILDEDNHAVPEGESGEIVISGANVGLGYCKAPELTKRSFFTFQGEPAYRTGDSGHQKGALFFCEGRKDFQVKFHGYRIELGDIETNLRALPGVLDAAVLLKRSERAQDFLAAFILSAAAEQSSHFERARELKKRLSERLPGYMIPQRFFFVESFPINANGKIDRKALLEKIA